METPGMKAIIEVNSLSYTYPSGVEALRGIDVTVYEKEFVAVMGQNGSGKTTFVKHLNGLLKPTRGRVTVRGKDTRKSRVSELARDVGYVFQNPDHQIFCDTVEAEVAFGPRNLGVQQNEIGERVQEALHAVSLLEYKRVNPKQLSKGQRQRVAVASVLSMKPSILIVDEPTTGQDYRDGIEMLELIKKLNHTGHTILFITHDMQLIARYAGRVIVFHEGKILLNKSTREVFSETEILKRTFLSPPSITLLAQRLAPLYPDTVLTVEEMLDQTLSMFRRAPRPL
jgi:energy-coupling factor transport system ATP-binding protein